jgi:hypothetical protein
MTPDQALQLLDQVCQNVAGTRKDHEAIMQAANTLYEFIEANRVKDTPCENCPEAGCEKCPNQS